MEDWERSLREQAEAILSDSAELIRDRAREMDPAVRDQQLRGWVANAEKVRKILQEIDERKGRAPYA